MKKYLEMKDAKPQGKNLKIAVVLYSLFDQK